MKSSDSVPRIYFLSTTIALLVCLAGCTRGEQDQSTLLIDTHEEPLLPATWTPTATPSVTLTLTPSNTPTPEATSTLVPTPVGMLSSLKVDNVEEIAWSPDGERIALLSRNRLSLYQASDLSLISRTEIKWKATNLNFSPDGMYIAACEGPPIFDENEGRLGVWDGINGTLVYEEIMDVPTCPAQFVSSTELVFYEPRDNAREENLKLVHIWEIGSGLVSQIEFNAIKFPHWLLDIGPSGYPLLFLVNEIYLGQPIDNWEFWIVRPGIGQPKASFPTSPDGKAYLTPNNRYLVLLKEDGCSFAFRKMGGYDHAFDISWCNRDWYKDHIVDEIFFDQKGNLIAVVFDHRRVVIWNIWTGKEVFNKDFPGAFLLDLAINPVASECALLARGPVIDNSQHITISKWELQIN